jgi:hypothetical protein
LGIPLTLITIADLAKYLSEKILKIGDWLEENVFKRNAKNDGNRSPENEVEMENEEGEMLMRQPGPYTKVLKFT